jgi:hypothetical protein
MVTGISEPIDRTKGARRRPGLLAVFAGVMCYLGAVQVLTIAAGLAGLTFDRTVAAAVAAAALVSAVLFATRFFEPSEGGANTARGAPRVVRTLAGLAGGAAVLWGAWVWLELWVLAWLRPPYDWDGLYYHLPAIHEWVAAGRVRFVGHMPNVPFVNFPMGVELHTYFAHHLLGTSRLVNACNLWYWPPAFLAIVVIATRLGARGVWRWAAGALIAGVPVFVCQSVSCYIGPGFNAAVMAAMAATLVFVSGGGRSAGWNAVLLGLAAGLVLGAKGTGLPFFVVFVCAAAAGALWTRGTGVWRRAVAHTALVAGVALLVGGYWYARNAVSTGNPVYPIRLNVGEKILIDGWDHDDFNNANLPGWLRERPAPLRMFISWTQPDAPIGGYAPVGGMGYVWLFGGLPAFLLLWTQSLRRRSAASFRPLVMLTVVALALLAVQPAAWWSRFTVWLHALGLPCLAVLMSRAVSGWRRSPIQFVVVLFVAGVSAVAVWEAGRTLGLEWAEGRIAETGGIRSRYLPTVDYMFPGLAGTEAFDRFLGANAIARSPWDSNATLLGGVLAMPLGRRSIVVLPHDPSESDVRRLRDLGIEWVLWDAVNAGELPAVLQANGGARHEYSPDANLKLILVRIQS